MVRGDGCREPVGSFAPDEAQTAVLASLGLAPLARRRGSSFLGANAGRSLSAIEDLHLRAVVGARWGDYGAAPKDAPLLEHAVVTEAYNSGAYYPVGGPARFAQTMQPVIEGAGGQVRLAADVKQIVGRISGLAPNQIYGFHVHEKGDCSSGDGMSAGGHFNPTGKPHGPPDGEHHAGDLPSLKADASGIAIVDVRVSGSVLGSGASDFYGKAVVVHALPDDYTTQPSGNSGPRIACGVIGTSVGRDAAGNPILVPKDL
jgi:Cu-Zn family superoxide dismutase